MNIKDKNINNLPHWQRIRCHPSSNTSLVSYILFSLVQNLTIPHCPDFLYKWSWGFCVMQMHCHEHKREEYKQCTPLATYLVSLIQYQFISFIYSLKYTYTKLGYTLLPDILYEWSWGFCVMPMHCHEHKKKNISNLPHWQRIWCH